MAIGYGTRVDFDEIDLPRLRGGIARTETDAREARRIRNCRQTLASVNKASRDGLR